MHYHFSIVSVCALALSRVSVLLLLPANAQHIQLGRKGVPQSPSLLSSSHPSSQAHPSLSPESRDSRMRSTDSTYCGQWPWTQTCPNLRQETFRAKHAGIKAVLRRLPMHATLPQIADATLTGSTTPPPPPPPCSCQ